MEGGGKVKTFGQKYIVIYNSSTFDFLLHNFVLSYGFDNYASMMVLDMTKLPSLSKPSIMLPLLNGPVSRLPFTQLTTSPIYKDVH